MCEYTQVEFLCGHLRFTVRAWCTNYEQSHRRCPPSIVAVEWRLEERCGACRAASLRSDWQSNHGNHSHIRT